MGVRKSDGRFGVFEIGAALCLSNTPLENAVLRSPDRRFDLRFIQFALFAVEFQAVPVIQEDRRLVMIFGSSCGVTDGNNNSRTLVHACRSIQPDALCWLDSSSLHKCSEGGPGAVPRAEEGRGMVAKMSHTCNLEYCPHCAEPV